MATQWVDFKTVKAAVSMQMALAHYDIDWLRKTGGELRGRCPIHKGESPDSFHVSVEKNCFQCFAGKCGRRGNVLDFVAAMEGCTVRDAAIKLAEWFTIASGALALEKPKARRASKSGDGGEEQAVNRPLTFELKNVDPDHEYIRERIPPEVAEEFGVGFFSGKGSMHGRVVIPIHNERGELIAYAGRSIDGEEPRYKLPAGFEKGRVLFNLHRAIERGGTGSTVVVVEGFFGCMRVHEASYPCVALMGSSLSEAQADLLCEHFSGVVLLLDGDEAGARATDECLLRLGRRMWVKAGSLPSGKQPDQLTAEELGALLK